MQQPELPIELPLYEVFQALRQKELAEFGRVRAADIQSYLQVVQVLQQGYCLQHADQLVSLCAKLWLKPFHGDTPGFTKQWLKDAIYKALKKYDLVDTGKAVADAVTPDQPVQNTAPPASQTGTGDGGIKPPFGEAAEPAMVEMQETNTLRFYVAAQNNQDVQQQAQLPASKVAGESFIVNGLYLPVNPRRIEQTIRSYKTLSKHASRRDIDLEATIERIAKQGYFDTYERRPQRSFSTDWTILIDHGGSMAAFEKLSDAIATAATSENINNKGKVLYFRNYPENFLYHDAGHFTSIPFKDFIAGPVKNIVIISDAGAARGGVNLQRAEATRAVLEKLGRHRVAWLNPIPRRRWKNTTAAKISGYVNMFEVGDSQQDNLGNIVRLFKDKINNPLA